MSHHNLEKRLSYTKNLFIKEYEKKILNHFIKEEDLEEIRYARELQNILGDDFISDETREIAEYSYYLQDFLDVCPTLDTKLRCSAFLISIKIATNQSISDEIAYTKTMIEPIPMDKRTKGQQALFEALKNENAI